MSDIPSRVALITGGNNGIGFATVRKLTASGFHVIMASRNQQTSTQAIARIKADQPNASVESIPLDLASFASVRQCAAMFKAKGYALHVLINNAGGSIKGKQASFTVDGFEIPYKRSTTPLDHADIVALRGDSLTTPDSITQFCGTQVSPNTAEVYGFQLQDAIAKYPRFKFSFTLANLCSE